LVGIVSKGDGVPTETHDLEANTGKVTDVVRSVADTLAFSGEILRAGDVIIAGSVVAPLFINAGDPPVTFELRSVGEVSIRFA
jgi:2-keto-4-pentenoate hydratase